MDNLLSAALASGAASFLPSSILDYLFGSMFMSKLPLPDRAMPAVCCLSAAAVFRWAALEDAYCKDAFVRKVYPCCAIPQTAGQASLARARGGRCVAGRERWGDWRCRRGSVCPTDAWKQARKGSSHTTFLYTARNPPLMCYSLSHIYYLYVCVCVCVCVSQSHARIPLSLALTRRSLARPNSLAPTRPRLLPLLTGTTTCVKWCTRACPAQRASSAGSPLYSSAASQR